MRLAREVDHYRWLVHELERAKHLLAAAAWRCPPIDISQYEHHRSVDILDVRDGRALDVVLRVVERRRLEPVRLEKREVRGVPPRSPVRDIALRHRRVKAMGLRDCPVRQQSTATATGDAQLVGIDVT